MAKNYTLKEAALVIANGTNTEELIEVGKRYPILHHKMAVLAAKAHDEFVDFVNCMPDTLTMLKVNNQIKGSVASVEADDSAADEVEADEKETKATASEKDYDSMSGKELYELLGKLGKRKECKVKYGLKKEDMAKFLKEMNGADTEADDEVEETEVEEVEADENPYEGKTAVELYTMCKKRKIKAEPKKPAKYYIALLVEADKPAEAEEEAEDDWDDVEEEEVKPAKPAKPAKTAKATKPTKPAKKEEPVEEDEDDDWDI